MEIVKRKVAELKLHPLNHLIYGENEDITDLIAQYEQTGRIDPLTLNQNDETVCGNRRLRLCWHVGKEEVDCIIKNFSSLEEEKKELLSNNKARTKTRLQKGREALEWLGILLQEAEARKQSNLKQNQGKNKQESQGSTYEKVAELTDLGSRENVRKIKLVIEKIDALKQEGKNTEAKNLIEILENESIHAAFKSLKGEESQEEEKNTYIYSGQMILGSAFNLEPGMEVKITNSPASSDPRRVYVRKLGEEEPFLVSLVDLQVVVNTPEGIWRNKRTFQAIFQAPAAENEEDYFKCDVVEVERQIAYSVSRQTWLERKKQNLQVQSTTAPAPEKKAIVQEVKALDDEISIEQGLQSNLQRQNASNLDYTKIRSYKEEIKGLIDAFPDNNGQLLPDKKAWEREGDPKSMVDAEPEKFFKEGDRIYHNTKQCLGTVHKEEAERTTVYLDDGSATTIKRPHHEILKSVSVYQEWQIYQQFTCRVTESIFVKCEYFTQQNKALRLVSDIFERYEHIINFNLQEVDDYVAEGITPIKLAQEIADAAYNKYQAKHQARNDGEEESEQLGEGEGEIVVPPQETSIIDISQVENASEMNDLIQMLGIYDVVDQFHSLSLEKRLKIKGFYPNIYDLFYLFSNGNLEGYIVKIDNQDLEGKITDIGGKIVSVNCTDKLITVKYGDFTLLRRNDERDKVTTEVKFEIGDWVIFTKNIRLSHESSGYVALSGDYAEIVSVDSKGITLEVKCNGETFDCLLSDVEKAEVTTFEVDGDCFACIPIEPTLQEKNLTHSKWKKYKALAVGQNVWVKDGEATFRKPLLNVSDVNTIEDVKSASHAIKFVLGADCIAITGKEEAFYYLESEKKCEFNYQEITNNCLIDSQIKFAREIIPHIKSAVRSGQIKAAIVEGNDLKVFKVYNNSPVCVLKFEEGGYCLVLISQDEEIRTRFQNVFKRFGVIWVAVL
jgi:hypothetical protein